MTRQLPPRPDPRTGEPRPPEAPRWASTDTQTTQTLDGFGEPPSGRGPMLEAHRVRRRYALGGTALIAGIFLIYVASTAGSGWYTDPFVWVLLAALVAYMLVVGGWNTKLAAGADWLRVRRRWVDTYALTKIKMHGPYFGWMLRLRDAEGRRVRTYPQDIETNHQLWDLVYNGMAHSVVNGATINPSASAVYHLRVTDDGKLHSPRQPRVSTRTMALVLAGLVAVFVVIGVLNPHWLGPALAIFAGLFLVVILPGLLILSKVVQRRDRRPLTESEDAKYTGSRTNRRGTKHRA